MEQNNKSDMQSDRTNAVVACVRSFGQRSSAIIVIKFPENNLIIYIFTDKIDLINNRHLPKIPTTTKMHAHAAAKSVAACG